MKYALLIYEDESVYGDHDSPLMQEIIGKHMAFGQEVGPAITGGAG
jgi:(2Fe-2S) ferredoxin